MRFRARVREFPGIEGLGSRNLRNMRDKAREWPDTSIVQQLVAKLPWGHNIQILRVPAGLERGWYAHAAIEHGRSRAVLMRQIETNFSSATARLKRTLLVPFLKSSLTWRCASNLLWTVQ
ncbi:DUF1016 N-terminal domain-containing protein [Edaphobacter sp.]